MGESLSHNLNSCYMRTEIKGNWIGYAKRFRMPSKKVLKYPLKHIGILLAVQIVVSGLFTFLPIPPIVKLIPIFAVMMFAVFYYLKVHWHTFWEVLEESKGLIPDLLMWLYYLIICIVSIMPSLIALTHIFNNG